MAVTKITERQSLARILGRLLSILIHKNIITKEDAEYILDPYEDDGLFDKEWWKKEDK